MSESPPSRQLLASLGRLTRGLSALFWGLPVALVFCFQTARGDLLRPLGVMPALAATALLCYGLGLLGHFQKQERVWHAALDRARVFALMNLGLSPFLYWWNKMPGNEFFNTIVELMALSGVLFLVMLNGVLRRLTAMLPDETLRIETRLFTNLNRGLLWFMLTALLAYFLIERVQQFDQLPAVFLVFMTLLQRGGTLLMVFLLLLPVAMTMALVWKTKEVILASVFGAES